MYSNPSDAASAATAPAFAGRTYRPAAQRGALHNTLAAATLIGRTGTHADLMLAIASVDGSRVVAVPPKARRAPAQAGACIGHARREPGGRDALSVELPHLANDDRGQVLDLAQRSAADGAADPGDGRNVFAFEWVHQQGATQ